MSKQGKQTVLVVDDIKSNIDMLVDILTDTYDVAVALDGEAALEIVRIHPPDLVLLDIMMPGMDGYEVCRRLKSARETTNIPVIFVTSRNEIEDEQQGLELGAVDYITKPISPSIVKARVKNHLALKEARDHLEDLVAERTRALLLKVKELEGRDQLVRFQMQSPDINTACREILLVITAVLDADKSRIYFPNESGSALQTVISSDQLDGAVPQVVALKSDAVLPFVSKAFQEIKVLAGNDNQIAAPIVYRDEILGILWVSIPASSPETKEENPNILWRMANEAAMVLRMAKFTEDLQQDRIDFDQLLDLAEQNLR